MKTTVKNFSNSTNRSIEHVYLMYGTSATFLLVFALFLYRFYIGDYIIGLVDLLIALILLFVGIKLDQSSQMQHLNFFLVALFMISLFWAIFMKGSETLYWGFPVISAIYFMVTIRAAITLSLLSLGVIYFILNSEIDKSYFLDFYPALILHGLFQFFWASRTACQQEKLFELATKDALTKVNNRLSFNEEIDAVIRRIRRNKLPVSLLMLDLDFFKKVNDTLGHDKGDHILTNFAQVIKNNIRKSDSIYRYGGEEFIIIADNTGLENASKLAEQLRKKVNHSPYLKQYGVTVSIGVTDLLANQDDVSSAINRVDKALYKAKKHGRNCVFAIDTNV